MANQLRKPRNRGGLIVNFDMFPYEAESDVAKTPEDTAPASMRPDAVHEAKKKEIKTKEMEKIKMKDKNKNYKGKYGNNPKYDNTNKNSDKYDSPKNHDKFQQAMRSMRPDALTSNAISWHDKAPTYSEAVKVPFAVIPGRPKNKVTNAQTTEYDFQGLTIVEFAPSIGYATGTNDPVNRAFNMIYAQMASKTSGTLLNMQQADLAFVTVGGSSIAAGLGYAKAVLELANTYAPSNMYFPKLILSALGFSHTDITDNSAKYRSILKDLVRRFNNLCIPNFTDIFNYHYMLARNLFADEDNQKAQVIKFVPSGFYLWKDTDNILQWTPFIFNWDGSRTDYSFYTFLSQLRDALNAWENSSIISLVKGNIQRFYTENEMFTIDYPEEGDFITPVVDRNINWQINNMIVHQVSTLSISQDVANNNLKFTPSWVFDSEAEATAANIHAWPLNSYDGDTSAEFIMESTRMIPQISGTVTKVGDKYYMPLKSACNILPTMIRIAQAIKTEDGNFTLNMSYYTDNVIPMDQATNPVSVKNLNNLTKFKCGPRVLIISENGDWTITSDINAFTYIDQAAITQLAEADLQSMYWINR